MYIYIPIGQILTDLAKPHYVGHHACLLSHTECALIVNVKTTIRR